MTTTDSDRVTGKDLSRLVNRKLTPAAARLVSAYCQYHKVGEYYGYEDGGMDPIDTPEQDARSRNHRMCDSAFRPVKMGD